MFEDEVKEAMGDAVEKAWKSLAGYKFWMFGYHAGRWVNYNRLLPAGHRHPNPFKGLVQLARGRI